MAKTLWVLLDNRRGSVGQALGVVDALDKSLVTVVEKKIEYNNWAALPNFIRGRTLIGLTEQSKQTIREPFPDMVLSISRRTVPVARYIKKMSPKTKLIQLMHPGEIGIEDFSLIIVPEHDRHKRQLPTMKYIVGCPHRITPEYLAPAKAKWQAKFADLPHPITALIVGGAIKGKPFSLANANALVKSVQVLKRNMGGSLLITTSRRTGHEAQNSIIQGLYSIPQYTYLWGDTGDNPYAGFLACADNIIVTGDSVSMCCEATGTGKPVYIFIGSNWLTPKHYRFVESLCESGCAALIDDKRMELFRPEKQINAAKEVARLIEKL
ncbi:MAG: mitochondrial fission ELM1 family protein [Alphaproteobacteria bacterium]|nr:mitochondrial fission ELM1 family protein [Alphaproteobacteria bacterium]